MSRREKTLETPAILKSGEDPGDEGVRYWPLWMSRDHEILRFCLFAFLLLLFINISVVGEVTSRNHKAYS